MASLTNITNPIKKGRIRKTDIWGKGQFGTPRGQRTHNGLDIAVRPGQDVFAPIDGTVVRIAYPYAKDLSYAGVLIEGNGGHKEYTIKIFYIIPSIIMIGKMVKVGDKIGVAQDLTRKYPGITNHIHMEVRHNKLIVNTELLIQKIR